MTPKFQVKNGLIFIHLNFLFLKDILGSTGLQHLPD